VTDLSKTPEYCVRKLAAAVVGNAIACLGSPASRAAREAREWLRSDDYSLYATVLGLPECVENTRGLYKRLREQRDSDLFFSG